MKNKRLLTLLVALAVTIVVSVSATMSVLGASDESDVNTINVEAVVGDTTYPSLEEAVDAAEGTLDNPVVILTPGEYVFDTDSRVVIAFEAESADEFDITVADDVFYLVTEKVDEEYGAVKAYILVNKDYLFADVADAINASSSNTGYSATYVNGALDLTVKVDDVADLADILTIDGLYDVLGAIAPIAVVSDAVSFDGEVVYNGTLNMAAVKEFASSKMLTLNELAGLTSKTITTFDIEVVSGTTTAVVSVAVSLDCTDEQFASIKENAATAAEYVSIANNGGVYTVVVDAVDLYKKAIAKIDSYNGRTTKEIRDEINSLTVNQLVDKLQAAGLTGKYATAVDVLTKLVNKLAATKYAGNLDIAVGVLDKDGDGVYNLAKTVTLSVDSLVAKLQETVDAQYPEYADYIDVEAMIGGVSFEISFDVTAKVYNQYTVKFVDENGNELYSETILDGELPVYGGETPAKEGTTTVVYEFAGWTDGTTVYETLPELTTDVEYTAVFNEVAIEGIDTSINAKSAAVVFNGRMSVKFYVPKAALEAYDNFYANVVITTADGDVESQVEGTVNGSYYQFVVYGVAAKQMNDNISFEVVATKTVEGVQITRNSEVKEYSVKQYAYNRLGAENATDAEKTMLVDFLNYGATAQIYFGYKADDLVNADLTAEQQGYASAAAPTLESDFVYDGTATERVIFKGASVLFVDNVSVKFILNYNYYRGTVSDTHLVVKHNGVETIVPGDALVENGKFYTYTFDSLSFKDLRAPITITVVETATGDVLSGPLTYSVETYAYNKQSSTNSDLVALLDNLMKFAVSAETYFN